jgi:hypothetical protein
MDIKYIYHEGFPNIEKNPLLSARSAAG